MHVWKVDPSSDSSTCNLIIAWKPGFSTSDTFSCPNIGIDESHQYLGTLHRGKITQKQIIFWLKRLLSKKYQVLTKNWLTFLWREHLFKHGYVQHLFLGGRRSLAKKYYRIQNNIFCFKISFQKVQFIVPRHSNTFWMVHTSYLS